MSRSRSTLIRRLRLIGNDWLNLLRLVLRITIYLLSTRERYSIWISVRLVCIIGNWINRIIRR
jgi:hypothetical protein